MNYKDIRTWTALITPMTDNGEVDTLSLEKILIDQIKAKNGVLLLGSTGEALNLNIETKKQIIEFSLNILKSHPTMVGLGGHLQEENDKWITYLNNFESIDLYLSVVPIYSKPGVKGQINWFQNILNTSQKPVMLYNVPSRSGTQLEIEALTELKDHVNFMGVKDASGDAKVCEEFINTIGSKGYVYCGDDALMSEFTNVGAYGLVSVASNVWPKETNFYVQQCLKNDLKEKETVAKSCNSLFLAPNPIPAKLLMRHNGVIKSTFVRPPLSHEEEININELLNCNDDMKNWYKRNI